MVTKRDIHAKNPVNGKRFDGLVFAGQGPAVLAAIANETDASALTALGEIVNRLLVKKGADWTSPILAEYLGLHADSSGTFVLVWDTQARQLVAHGAAFQSAAHPGAALLAHIRTAEGWNGLGLGTLVTAEATHAAFQRGAGIVCLATDDKRHRLQQGERAAHRMYSRLGYTILAERELADTVDWLLAIGRQVFELRQANAQAAGGRFETDASAEVAALQAKLVADTRARFSAPLVGEERIGPVGQGDLAGLFLLLNLCPPDDFHLKLGAWGVQLGPEIERSWVVNLRPAIADRDRLEDASLAQRDGSGAILAVCAAKQVAPFTRNRIDVDFYCLPEFFAANRARIATLVDATLARIRESPARPRPCRVTFSGIDAAKTQLFRELGFERTRNTQAYFAPGGPIAFVAEEYEKRID